MFSFHKPKVYRSSTGCCICKAKSSSSRFTDSKKYEDDFVACFQLKDRRSGEICNACVLLVKRWKKLPEGSDRNWGHVVDVRAGPGTKSLTKFKSKNKKLKMKMKNAQMKEKLIIKKKHMYIKSDRLVREQSPGALSDDITGEDFLSDLSGPSMPASLAPSPVSFQVIANRKSKMLAPTRRVDSQLPSISNFLDMTYWKIEIVCCGTIFKGQYGELMLDPEFFKPCSACDTQKPKPPTVATAMEITTSEVKSTEAGSQSNSLAKNYSDSSSDSGYDESSNPGVVDANHVRSGNTNVVTNNPLADFAMHAANRCLQVPAPAN